MPSNTDVRRARS